MFIKEYMEEISFFHKILAINSIPLYTTQK